MSETFATVRADNLTRDLPTNTPGTNAVDAVRSRYRVVRAETDASIASHRPPSRFGTPAAGPVTDLA
jgi:hypothetical protein